MKKIKELEEEIRKLREERLLSFELVKLSGMNVQLCCAIAQCPICSKLYCNILDKDN